MPSLAATHAAFLRQQNALQSTFPGEITIAGQLIKNCAVKQQALTLALPGGGAVEKRGLIVSVAKTLIRGAIAPGTTVTEQEKDYIVNSISGGESWCPFWKLVCIEKERI